MEATGKTGMPFKTIWHAEIEKSSFFELFFGNPRFSNGYLEILDLWMILWKQYRLLILMRGVRFPPFGFEIKEMRSNSM